MGVRAIEKKKYRESENHSRAECKRGKILIYKGKAGCDLPVLHMMNGTAPLSILLLFNLSFYLLLTPGFFQFILTFFHLACV